MNRISQSFIHTVAIAVGLLCSTSVVTPQVLAQQLPMGLEASADELQFIHETDLLQADGNVRIEYDTMVIEADKVLLNTKNHDIEATGSVVFSDGSLHWQGRSVNGNLETRQFDFAEFYSVFPPWYVVGEDVSLERSGDYTSSGVALSTCEYLPTKNPHWQMRSKRIVYYPDGGFKIHNVVYKIGDIPVFYFPVLWGNTNQTYRNFRISAGYKSDFGPIINVGRQWKPFDSTRIETELIYREKRGLAFNGETSIQGENSATTGQLYLMHDIDPLFDFELGGAKFNSRFEVERDRFRLKTNHRQDTTNKQGALRLNADYFSDNDLLLEFFRRDYRDNPQPTSQVDLRYSTDIAELSLNYRPRLNDFESVVERLPEVRVDIPRTPIAGTGLLYAGETSYAKLRMNWREYDIARVVGDVSDYSTDRFDSLNFLYFPARIGFLSIVPRAGARVTSYSRTSTREVNQDRLNAFFRLDDPESQVTDPTAVVNYDDNGGRRSRIASEFGLEMSWRYVGHWRQQEDASTGAVPRLRHHLTPFINYTYIPSPDEKNTHLFFFDEIDRIQKAHFVRLGTRQSFELHGAGGYEKFLHIGNHFDFHMSADGDYHVPGDFGTDIEIIANDRLSVFSNILVDSDRGSIDVVTAGATLRENEIQFGLGYLYRRNFLSRYSYSMGSQLEQITTTGFMPTAFDANHNLHCDLSIPINDANTIRIQYFFDLNRDKVGRQIYEWSRDLHCWVGSVRVEQDAEDLSLLLIFSLKAFPRFHLDVGG